MNAPSLPTAGQTVVVDASVWIGSLLPNDVHYVPAQFWLNAHVSSGGHIVAPLILPLETGSAIARVKQDVRFALDSVSDLYSFQYISLQALDQSLIDEATDIAITFRLRSADSIYVALGKRLAVPLVTFDQEQISRPASIITTIRP